MSLVTNKLKITVVEFEYGSHRRIDFHLRELERLTLELKPGLLEVVRIEMRIAERKNELARLQIAHLRNHHREQRIRRDVERQPEKDVSGSLIHLTRELSIGNIELKKQVTRRQRHLRKLADVPRADNQPARIRIPFDLIDDLTNLIDDSSVCSLPGSPLRAVDRPKLSVSVCPFVPDLHAMLIQLLYIGVALKEAEQFVDDRLEVKLLGGDYRKTFAEIESQLIAKDRPRAGPRAIFFFVPLLEDVLHQVKILLHPKSNRSSFLRLCGPWRLCAKPVSESQIGCIAQRLKAYVSISRSLNVRPRLNYVKSSSSIDPLDILIASAEYSFDPNRSVSQPCDHWIGQHSALLIDCNFLHTAVFIKCQHRVFVGAREHLNSP